MKNVRLNNIQIKNWRGQTREISFSNRTAIEGRNNSGKTTIYNAFLWLLTGSDDKDRANYQLFDITVPQTHENSKLASVEASFTIDGMNYLLKRTAEQGWMRKRGNVEYERKGSDTYKFYIDDIERSATEYKNFIEETFAGMDKLKIMLNIQYFLSLDWKVMRKQFESMVGEIKESDFKGDYGIISEDLDKYTTDELKKQCKARIKPLQESIDRLPVRIETLQSNIPDISVLPELRKDIEEVKKDIKDIDDKILGNADSAKKIIAERKEIMDEIESLQRVSSKAGYEHFKHYSKLEMEIEQELMQVKNFNSNVDKENAEIHRKKNSLEKGIETLKSMARKCEERHHKLSLMNKEVKELEFTDDICPVCGQLLPSEMIEVNKAKFYEEKGKKHQQIVSEGKENRKEWNNILSSIEENEKKLESDEFAELTPKSTDALEAKLKALKDSYIPYRETADGKKQAAEIEAKEHSLKNIKEEDNSALLNMKQSLMQDLEDLSKKLSIEDEYKKCTEQIKEAQEELRKNSIEKALLEGKLEAIKAYEEEKADIVSERINGMFEYVTVKMSTTDKSGNIVPCCEIRDAGNVPCMVTNFASMVRSSIDLSNAFCKFYGLNLPLFIDFAESISHFNLPNCDRQTVLLRVTDGEFNVINE